MAVQASSLEKGMWLSNRGKNPDVWGTDDVEMYRDAAATKYFDPPRYVKKGKLFGKIIGFGTNNKTVIFQNATGFPLSNTYNGIGYIGVAKFDDVQAHITSDQVKEQLKVMAEYEKNNPGVVDKLKGFAQDVAEGVSDIVDTLIPWKVLIFAAAVYLGAEKIKSGRTASN